MIQLTEEEANAFKDCPVVLDFGSGFYVFPVSLLKIQDFREFARTIHEQPNEKRIMKMATHVAGYTHKLDGNISIPRTVLSYPECGLLIPKPDLQQLRNQFRKVYPSLAEKPFLATRLCW